MEALNSDVVLATRGCPSIEPPSTGAQGCVVSVLLCISQTAIPAEPPVKILQPCRPVPVMTVSPGETVTLCCELSREDAPVLWAKEGVRLEAGGSLVLEEEGAHRRLLIPAAQAEHSGKYTCATANDTVTFTIQVLGEHEAREEHSVVCWVQKHQRPQLCWCWMLQIRWSGSWRRMSC